MSYHDHDQPMTPSLKRSRPLHPQRSFDPSRLPLLPRLPTDIALQVFTHKSLRRPNASSPAHFGDNERLQELGRAAFEAALILSLFQRRPFLRAPELHKYHQFLLSSSMVDDWVVCYKLKSKFICDPAVLRFLDPSQESRSLFHAYVGGLYLSSGPQAVNDWITALLEQEFESMFGVSQSESDDLPTVEIPPQKRARSETMLVDPKREEQMPPVFYASQPPTTPPPPQPFSTYVPAPKPPPPPPNPLAPAQPDLPFLPLFNQVAAQRRVTVEYLAESIGPPHAARWLVKCIGETYGQSLKAMHDTHRKLVNGISKGEGYGNTKQVAKEAAAREAYYSMGWT